MLQSKKRTKKLQRKELSDYKRLVKLLDANFAAVLKQGLYWKRRLEETESMYRGLYAQYEAQKIQVRPPGGGLIIL
jgi:hypothetical protein